MKSILTERLTIAKLREEDFGALISVLKHEAVSKTYMVPNLNTPEDEQKLFSTILNLSRRSDRYVYGIFLKGLLIGVINDTDIAGNQIELGYALHPDFFSRGYMTEALDAVITHLFLCGFKEIICGAFEDNLSRIRVMEKCGMVKLRKTETISYRGEEHLCVFYSIKKSK